MGMKFRDKLFVFYPAASQTRILIDISAFSVVLTQSIANFPMSYIISASFTEIRGAGLGYSAAFWP
jgi:hypothetical protein